MRSHNIVFILLSLFLPVTDAFQSLAPVYKSATTYNNNNNNRNIVSTSLHALDPVQAWEAYNDALASDPLLVKSVTAGVILGAADLAGQALEDIQKEGDESSELDIARTIRFAFFGLVLQAPWNHFYYQILDGAIPPTADPWTPTTAIKTVIDQFVQAPIFTVLIFGFLGLLEGKTLESIKQQLEDDYTDTMVANCTLRERQTIEIAHLRKEFGQFSFGFSLSDVLQFFPNLIRPLAGKLWVPATVVNLAFVPPILRVLYLNCVFFFWSIFLSLKLNKDESSSESL